MFPGSASSDAVTDSMTAVERAEADGKAMGRAIVSRPEEERQAWLRGIQAVLGLDLDPSAYRGLVPPPPGWVWAEEATHLLQGSEGLAHLIPDAPRSGAPADVAEGNRSRCGMPGPAWVTVGRWESTRREACPTCGGGGVTS